MHSLGALIAESMLSNKVLLLLLHGSLRAFQRSRAAACLQFEGNVWRALGIMTAAGGLRNAALLLRELRMPDAAAAFCAACKEAGFHSAYVPADAGQAARSRTIPKAPYHLHILCKPKELAFASTASF